MLQWQQGDWGETPVCATRARKSSPRTGTERNASYECRGLLSGDLFNARGKARDFARNRLFVNNALGGASHQLGHN